MNGFSSLNSFHQTLGKILLVAVPKGKQHCAHRYVTAKRGEAERNPRKTMEVIGTKEKWHAGELAVQETVMGKRYFEQNLKEISPLVRDYMPEQHSIFFTEVPWFVVATLDSDGHPRASLLQGLSWEDGQEVVKPIFQASDDRKSYTLSKEAILELDEFKHNTEGKAGEQIGMLGIQLHTRRRNRVNGRISARSNSNETAIELDVVQSFGNCPKYIQSRTMRALKPAEMDPVARDEVTEDFQQFKEVFETADTFFIASGRSDLGVDASHRGGPPGFIKVSEDCKTIKYPEFIGNGFFQTLGNIKMEPRVGILIINFNKSIIYQFRGRASIDFKPDPNMPGSTRVVMIELERVTVLRGCLKIAFSEDVDYSPFLPTDKESSDELSLIGVKHETHDTITLYLSSKRPILHNPGQYGNFSVTKGDKVFSRAWTISSTPKEGPYGAQVFAITVKRKEGGQVSPLLHDRDLQRSLKFRLMGTEGEFSIPKDGITLGTDEWVVFAAAGSGITPVMSNLRRIATVSADLKVVVFYSVRMQRDVIFRAELANLASDNIKIIINVTRESVLSARNPLSRHVLQFGGRVSSKSISESFIQILLDRKEGEGVPFVVHSLYVCGPDSFSKHFIADINEISKPKTVISETFNF